MALSSLYLSDLKDPERTAARFWSYVEKTDACWVWTRCRRDDGYGTLACRFHDRTRTILAHRLAYLLSCTELPAHLLVRHLCHNRLCVRPDHLALGTAADNWSDCRQSGHARPFPARPGSLNAQAKLTEEQVRAIIVRYQAGEKQADLARAFGVSDNTISKLRTTWWAHVREAMGIHGPVPDNTHGRNGFAKLTVEQVREIRLHHAHGTMSFRQMAAHYGVHKKTIERVAYGKLWRHVAMPAPSPAAPTVAAQAVASADWSAYRQLALGL
jgi:hypothetical protein